MKFCRLGHAAVVEPGLRSRPTIVHVKTQKIWLFYRNCAQNIEVSRIRIDTSLIVTYPRMSIQLNFGKMRFNRLKLLIL